MNIELQPEITRLGQIVPWYHRFELPDGIIIPGWEGIYGIWDNIRKARERIEYRGKRVLDLGSRDGMWAFEAEGMGASHVIATDMGCEGYREHILFIKAVKRSLAGVYFNIPVQDLARRLDCLLADWGELFDVIQHLGLFYHLEDPIISLRECRKCLKLGGKMLFETAIFLDKSELPLALYNSLSHIYEDRNTYWAFNRAALVGALTATGFAIDLESVTLIEQSERIGRLTLVATAV